MIIRKRIYQCDHCPTRFTFPWRESYPEAITCQKCKGKARIIGFGDASTAKIFQANKSGIAGSALFGVNLQRKERD